MLRHTTHREFMCETCGRQFKRKDKLKEHIKRMHSADKEARTLAHPHRESNAKKFTPRVGWCGCWPPVYRTRTIWACFVRLKYEEIKNIVIFILGELVWMLGTRLLVQFGHILYAYIFVIRKYYEIKKI